MNDSPPYQIWSFYGIFYGKVTGFTEIPQLSCKKSYNMIILIIYGKGAIIHGGVSEWYTGLKTLKKTLTIRAVSILTSKDTKVALTHSW